MLVAAALVPDTALLVPGAAGRAVPADPLAAAAAAAVRHVVSAAVAEVVVVAPGLVDRELTGPVTATLAPAGVPDHLLRDAPPTVVAGRPPGTAARAADPGRAPSVGTAVALHLLAAAGWSGPTRLVEVAHPRPVADEPRAAELRARGRDLVAQVPTALVVVGSASGRHGPDAPLADDERAPGHDARVLTDLGAPDLAARARLAADDEALAHALAVSGWAPWQVLVGAAGHDAFDARTLRSEVLLGAQHAALVWARA